LSQDVPPPPMESIQELDSNDLSLDVSESFLEQIPEPEASLEGPEAEIADEDEDAEMRYYGDCSSSTSKSQIRQINQLRRWKNRVTCSQNLVWLAWKHTVDQNKFYNAGGRYSDSCNMHSWKYGPARCCYSKGNGPCMWKAFEKLAGYSIGNVYEVSAWSSANGYTFNQAVAGWKKSSGHNVVIYGKSGWAKNTKKGGCYASGRFVNCIFTA